MYIYYTAGPVDPLTPGAVDAILAAEDASKISSEVRKESWLVMDQSERIQHAVHRAVNQGLTQKLAQTVTLVVSANIKIIVPAACRHLYTTSLTCIWYNHITTTC